MGDRLCWVDGEATAWQDLIRYAKRCGYAPIDGMAFTSEAAQFLRDLGHTVRDHPEEEEFCEVGDAKT